MKFFILSFQHHTNSKEEMTYALYPKSNDIRSMFIPSVTNSKIFIWTYLLLEDLVMQPLNTIKGISIAKEDPYGFKHINITRRGVLRQYYGRDISYCHGSCLTKRYTYGYNKCNSSVNTDPCNYVTKPFAYWLNHLSTQIHLLLLEKKEKLNLQGLDLSTTFNHCTALLYYSGPSLKPLAHMPFHCDVSYNHQGKYVTHLNEQVENTPSVIISLGDDRKLHWQRQILKVNKATGRLKWYNIEKNIFKKAVNLGDKTIYLVNTLDEKPYLDSNTGCYIRYQHGNVNVTKDTMSCGLVLRVVHNVCTYNTMNQLVEGGAPMNNISTNDNDKEKHAVFHRKIQEVFKRKFTSYRP